MCQCTMCHHFDERRWEEQPTDDPLDADEESETPEFLAEEPADDVELLTDGGDD